MQVKHKDFACSSKIDEGRKQKGPNFWINENKCVFS